MAILVVRITGGSSRAMIAAGGRAGIGAGGMRTPGEIIVVMMDLRWRTNDHCHFESGNREKWKGLFLYMIWGAHGPVQKKTYLFLLDVGCCRNENDQYWLDLEQCQCSADERTSIWCRGSSRIVV